MEVEVVSSSRRKELPITVRGPDGNDLKIPRWMTEPAAGRMQVSELATLAIDALRNISDLLGAHDRLKSSALVTDAWSPMATKQVMTVEQKHFEWVEQNERSEQNKVALELETTKTVITLMARVLIAVVRAAEEASDDR
jgi:hypothetical protein